MKKSFILRNFVKKIIRFQFLYQIEVLNTLENLKELILETKMPIDVSNLSQLISISGDYDNLKGIDKLTSLESLYLWRYKPASGNFVEFQNMNHLKKLELNQSSLESLDGIGDIEHLEELEIAYAYKLNNIDGLSALRNSLRYLRIDDCKKITSFNVIKSLINLKTLALCDDSTMDSIDFIEKLHSLESFIFSGTTVIDGNVSYCKRLKHAEFTNKKHYSNKSKDFNKNYDGKLELNTSRLQINNILELMREYLDECGDVSYSLSDVKKCGSILKKYIKMLETCVQDQSKIKECVKNTVIELNILNEQLDYSLIETQEREEICSFLLEFAQLCGLETLGDITEEWREW